MSPAAKQLAMIARVPGRLAMATCVVLVGCTRPAAPPTASAPLTSLPVSAAPASDTVPTPPPPGFAAPFGALEHLSPPRFVGPYRTGDCLDRFVPLSDGGPRSTQTTLPSRVDLRAEFPAVFDQGQIGSCVPSAAVAGVVAFYRRQVGDTTPYSVLFIYNLARMWDDIFGEDGGSLSLTVMDTIIQVGLVPETGFAYATNRVYTPPSSDLLAIANQHRYFTTRKTIQTTWELKQSLAQGNPVNVDFVIYPEFEHAPASGYLGFPNLATETPGDGHEVVCVGYDDLQRVFIIRNSWGSSWGLNGYAYVPYDWVKQGLMSVGQVLLP